MNKENLRAVLFTALSTVGFDIKPYCILDTAYDALYLPNQHTILPIDLADDKGRRNPYNPVAQNNLALKDGLNVFRIRSMECTPIALTSFDYYLDDFKESTVLSLINYLGTEFGISTQLTELPKEEDSIASFEQALNAYDDYFKTLCCAYADETGHAALKKSEMFHNEHIGVWIHFKNVGYEIKHNGKIIRSRKSTNKSSLDDIHTNNLANNSEQLEKQWMDNYNELKKFCDENGGISSVKRNVKPHGAWLTRQRTARRNGKLSPEHERLLDELGVVWDPNNNLEEAWNNKFDMLLEYKKEHGSVDVPQSNGSLGRWVAKQRYLKQIGKLPANREQRLLDIGFVWRTK